MKALSTKIWARYTNCRGSNELHKGFKVSLKDLHDMQNQCHCPVVTETSFLGHQNNAGVLPRLPSQGEQNASFTLAYSKSKRFYFPWFAFYPLYEFGVGFGEGAMVDVPTDCNESIGMLCL